MAQMFGGQPGAADAFAQMQKELAKIKGTRILEIQRMGGTGTGIEAPANGAGSTPPPSGSSVAGQVATDTAQQTASGEASSHLGGSIPGAALGGALMNAWHRKSSKPAAQPAAAPAPAATTTPAGGAATDVTLMEMTTQTNNFSHESIPMSVFDVPGGFKQVESPMKQFMSK